MSTVERRKDEGGRMKAEVSAEAIHGFQQNLLHAYEWGIANGYITFDGDGQPVFAVPEAKDEGGRMKAESRAQKGEGVKA